MTATQNYSNHVRWFPLFHFVISPLLLVGLIYLIDRLVQEPSWDRAVWVGFAFAIILVSLSARVQALKAQDRIIRLEETLRYRELLDPGLAKRAMNLEPKTLIPLRFGRGTTGSHHPSIGRQDKNVKGNKSRCKELAGRLLAGVINRPRVQGSL